MLHRCISWVQNARKAGLPPIIAAFLVAAAMQAASLTISQSGQEFSQTSASIAAGASIIFANDDDVTHNINVIDEDDNAIDLGLQKPGQSLTYVFAKTGRFKVRCSIHPRMKVVVDVK